MDRYCVKNWQGHFETNETRKLKALNWWPKPNKHDGLGFRRMVAERDKIQLFCAWNLICDLASKTTPQGRRGFLERDSKPLNAEDMAFMTGFPADIFTRALGFFSNPSIGWLCVESAGTPGESAGVPGESAVEGKGREEKEEKEIAFASSARIVIHLLNEQTGKHFRETGTSLEPITARLAESGVTLDGVKLMVQRQVTMWKGTDMEEYLRPSTLFAPKNFNNYYASKDNPIPPKRGQQPDPGSGNDGLTEREILRYAQS